MTEELNRGCLQWVAFDDQPPPESCAKDDASVRTINRVLVTNNLGAHDRMGRKENVWLASPIWDGEMWIAFDEGNTRIEALTHWFDPFASLSTSKQAGAEPVAVLNVEEKDHVCVVIGSLPVGTHFLYSTPPAVMPAAPSDAGWQPLATAPDGERVLLGPRDAPVVGIVRQMPEWADDQAPIASVIHYNGTTLVAGYHCSEWHPLPAANATQAEPAAGQTSSIAEKALQEIATLTNRTATPEQFARHLQRIAYKALNGEYDE